MVSDINGLKLSKGDVVAPVAGDMKGKVCGLKTEDGEGFVCIRAAHRPYSKGVWYASEHVQRLAIGKVRARPSTAEGDAKAAAAAPAGKGRGASATVEAKREDARKTTRPTARSGRGRSAARGAVASN